MYSNKHFCLDSDLRQVGGFLRVLRFPPPIKLKQNQTKFRYLDKDVCLIFISYIYLHKKQTVTDVLGMLSEIRVRYTA